MTVTRTPRQHLREALVRLTFTSNYRTLTESEVDDLLRLRLAIRALDAGEPVADLEALVALADRILG